MLMPLLLLTLSTRADVECRYLNNGYSYDSKISRL